jgi:hypothetical protein
MGGVANRTSMKFMHSLNIVIIKNPPKKKYKSHALLIKRVALSHSTTYQMLLVTSFSTSTPEIRPLSEIYSPYLSILEQNQDT